MVMMMMGYAIQRIDGALMCVVCVYCGIGNVIYRRRAVALP